ncbi:DUF4880 domain-containing protein [Pseudomonas putida]|uniref:DUF4880 domain-containing protein n=1 Tax=Pseudomonas putida TaxID=303 RepID=UPI0023645A69|nr:DUF4880 domain-containing protein [Pseudomonas putida]MDD2052059.1 DUF4880 domain-containing protein [Pseudomonas putida]
MPTSETAPLEAKVVDQAIGWLVRLRFDRPDPATVQAFEHWLGQRPEHARAWQRVATLGAEFSGLPPTLTRQTLEGTQRQISRREGLKLLGLGLGASSLAWLGREHLPWPATFADYHTAVGEQRRVVLADGSQLQLNTDTAVDFNPQQRELRLRQGEILVETGADSQAPPARPFWSRTRDGYVQAQRSRFLLRERVHGTLLAVQHGSVTVFAEHDQQTPVRTLGAGEQWLFTANGPLPLANEGFDPWSWSAGVLSARQMRLGAFIDELARYRRGVLRYSPAVADLRVSGTYQLADTDEVLALLAQALPVQVRYRSRYWVTLDLPS